MVSNSIEAEFDRFVTSLLPDKRTFGCGSAPAGGGGSRGPKPTITTETITARAMKILDEEGDRTLTVRRLAADLSISTRTLYKRIHNRENLLRGIAAMYASQVSLPIRRRDSWKSAALLWCTDMHHELTSHPHLTFLLGHDLRDRVVHCFDELVNLAIDEGIPRSHAVECCTTLVAITVNSALADVRSSRLTSPPLSSDESAARVKRDLEGAIVLIIAGMQALNERRTPTKEPGTAAPPDGENRGQGPNEITRAHEESLAWSLADVAEP